MGLFSKTDLDNIDYKKYDSGKMVEAIDLFAANCREAWDASKEFVLPSFYVKANKFLISGMGASGISGDIVKDLLKDSGIIVETVHDYTMPGWVDKDTVVIACSFSGDTEETLNVFGDAYNKGAKLIAITSGGKLQLLSEKYKSPCFTFSFDGQPRAAFPFLFISLLSVFVKLGHLKLEERDIIKNFESLQQLTDSIKTNVRIEKNACKVLANKIKGKIPCILASGHLSSVAKRFKTQINENSKGFAMVDIYPELDHNLIEASDPGGCIYYISLISNFYKKEITERQNLTAEIFTKNKLPHENITFRCDNVLEEILQFVLFGDYLSYYLGILNRSNITEVNNIKYLKSKL